MSGLICLATADLHLSDLFLAQQLKIALRISLVKGRDLLTGSLKK